MKKEKYVEYNGMFGDAVDYKVYHMHKQDTLVGALVGAVVGAVAIAVFFNIWILTILAIPAGAVSGVIIYKNMLLEKRSKKLILQFRDMLESISSSLGSGRNVNDAFGGAYQEMYAQYGEDASIVHELAIIQRGLSNNINIEALLQDFAKRSHNENVQNFADVFTVANRRGGNIRQIIFETKNVINEKIMVEQEIQTLISGKKNELNIMMFLPFIVVNQAKAMQSSSPQDFWLNFAIKIVAFFMFVIAYIVGQKMMKIEV